MKSIYLRLYTTAVVATIAACVSSCEKDTPPSKTPLLVEKSWIVVSYEIDGDDAMEVCVADNSLIFFSNGVYNDDTGDLLCEEDETDTDGFWKFKGNETIISLHPTGDVESDWSIIELTASTFRISQYVEILDSEVTIEMTVKN